jgi:hypothetical protein
MVQRAAPRTQRVLLLVWDGMRPDCVTEALTPNLWAFATRGAWYHRAVGIFPSVTRPTTASVSTGAYPAAHGLIANRFVGPPSDRTPIDTGDRAALERLRLLNAWWRRASASLCWAVAQPDRRRCWTRSGLARRFM